MFDFFNALLFGTRFRREGVDWVRLSSLGDGRWCLAVTESDVPAPQKDEIVTSEVALGDAI